MSMGSLNMVAAAVDGTLVGADRNFDSVSTDTRTLRAGQLFFALQGEHFDAERFIEQAAKLGAAGAVVRARHTVDMPQVEVDDTRLALGRLAAAWRDRIQATVIGVTGSNGKTTVKEMLASILREHCADASELLVTRGNLNNDIGLPLTVLELRPQHRVAVLEMGASHPGEIAYLAKIARPGIGIVTNAGSAHLEGFGSETAVAATKGEMFECLTADGVAVINRDDAWFESWRERAAHARVVTFGLHSDALVRASDIAETGTGVDCRISFTLHAPGGTEKMTLPMAGRHNVMNALAAAAAVTAMGVSLEDVRRGLANAANVSGRLRALTGRDGAIVYDDSYNANPVSVRAAIDFLAARDGERCFVLGDMAELGADSDALHRGVGDAARASGIQRLICVGPRSRASALAFGEDAEWFGEVDELVAAMRERSLRGMTILVKASRSMGLERVVRSLLADDEDYH